MKSSLKFTFALCLLLAAFSSCKKDKDDPSSTPGTKVPVGANVSFSCMVGGTAYAATHLQAFQTNGGGTSTTLWRYTLTAEKDGANLFTLQVQNLQGAKITAGTYDLSQSSNTNVASLQYNDGQETWQAVTGSGTGTWTISTLSGNKTSGTFSALMRGISGDSIMVTDGEYTTDNYGEI